MRKLDARQLAREKNLFRYSSALERADFSAVEAVLKEAERDPLLAQMIAEVNTVYESETFRLSPSLNHSSNHRQTKDLLMTTLVLPNRQRNMQRWLPITLAAACVSMLFIGALMLHPIRPNNILAGLQAQSSATPSPAATATLIPSPTAANAVLVVTVPPTLVPPDVQFSASAVGTPVCGGVKVVAQDTAVRAQPSIHSTVIGHISAGTQVETVVTGHGIDDATSGSNTYWFFIKVDVDGNSVQGWVSTNSTQPLDPANACPTNEVTVASGDVSPTVTAFAIQPVVISSNVTCDSKDAVILSPASDSVVAGTVDISGIATAPNFGSYKLELIGLGTGGKYISMVDGTQAVVSAGQLGQINLSSFPPDNYGLRLSVFDGAQQLQGKCLVNFTLARAATIPNVAVPADVTVTAIPITVLPISAVVTTQALARTSPVAYGVLSLALTPGVVVNVDSQSADGQWSHVVLDGGKNGWVLTNVLQLDTANIQVAVPASASVTKAVVILSSSALRDQPNFNATSIEIVKPNTVVTVTNISVDGLWKQVVLPDGTQGWLLGTDTESVTTIPQQTMLCGGTIGNQPAQIFSRPNTSGNGVAIGTISPDTIVAIYDVDNQSANASAWYYVQGVKGDGTSVQGWVETKAFAEQSCSTSTSIPDQFTVVVATPVPNGNIQAATTAPVAVQPVFSIAGTPICINAITMDGTTAHVTNQTDKDATLFAAPLTSNSNASVVGILPAKAEAMLLYQQYDQQSAGSIGGLWYLIMTTGEGDKQVTGWVSANSITTETGCASDAAVSGTTATVTWAQLEPITGVAMTDSTQIGTCHIINLSPAPATLFAAPLTKDSNAPAVGTLSTNGNAVVIFQNYDVQSAPSGTLWYLVTTSDNQQVTGWVSATSLNSSNTCAPEQLTGVTLSSVALSQDQIHVVTIPDAADSVGAGTVQAVPSQLQSTEAAAVVSSDTAPTGICHVVNPQIESVPVYSGPSSKSDEATLVNNLTPNVPAVVLYQQRNTTSGEVWYLVLAVEPQGKQISGWVSADSLKVVDSCPVLP